MKSPLRAVLIIAALIMAAVIALAYAAYRRDIELAFERVSTGSQIVQTPCGPIEYAIAGAGEPVLVVHGAGGGFEQGIDFAEDLAASRLRVIAMSRFGYLRTPLPADASAAAQADGHACLLDALGIRRAAIVGASAGAPSSMQFALRHPERCTALVLMVPAAYVPRSGGAASMKTPAWTEFLFGTALRSDFLLWAAIRLARPTVIGSILATPPEVVESADAEEQARVAQILDHILPISQRRLGLVNDAAITSTLPRYALERIQAPTLVISLADDRFGTYDGARYTAEHIPGARFIGYASGGHVWVGHQKEVTAEIAAFLKRVATSTRRPLFERARDAPAENSRASARVRTLRPPRMAWHPPIFGARHQDLFLSSEDDATEGVLSGYRPGGRSASWPPRRAEAGSCSQREPKRPKPLRKHPHHLGAEARRVIAIRIDPQVLDAVRREAKRRGLGYQSLINNLLAKHIVRIRSA